MDHRADSSETVDATELRWRTSCHLIALTGWVTAGAGFLAGPLILWLAKRDASDAVNFHGKEASNFQLTMLIVAVALFLMPQKLFGVIGIISALLIPVFGSVMAMVAAIKTNKGEKYLYPINFRLIK